jgi:hypothetical protein
MFGNDQHYFISRCLKIEPEQRWVAQVVKAEGQSQFMQRLSSCEAIRRTRLPGRIGSEDAKDLPDSDGCTTTSSSAVAGRGGQSDYAETSVAGRSPV